MLKLLKLFTLLNLFTESFSEGNCDLINGYTWCATSLKCVRVWDEPCLPVTKECAVCLTSNTGVDCGEGCDIQSLQTLISNGFQGTDEYGCSSSKNTIWCPSLNRCIDPQNELCRDTSVNPEELCHQINCAMFCSSGFQKDANGCDICVCSDINTPPVNSCVIPEQECPYEYVCPRISEVTYCSQGGIPGHTTYQLSLFLKDGTNAKDIYALYGSVSQNMFIPRAYQELNNNIFNSNFGGVQEGLIDINPDSRYDSWITIGLTDGDPEHKISSVGVDFDKWNGNHDLIIDNGAIFLLNPEEKIIDGEEYIIMQLTIPNSVETNVSVNVQGKVEQPGLDNMITSWSEENIQFYLTQPTPLPDIIPYDCVSWFDGCNYCITNNGIKYGCTKNMCSSTTNPECLSVTNGH